MGKPFQSSCLSMAYPQPGYVPESMLKYTASLSNPPPREIGSFDAIEFIKPSLDQTLPPLPVSHASPVK